MPPERIGLHGNNKSDAEIDRAVAAGIGRVVVDGLDEIARVAAAGERHGRRVPVLLRVTVGVEAHTHEYIATAHEDQKFGLSLAGGQARKAVDLVLAQDSWLDLRGLHSHIGSQIFDTSGFDVAAHRIIGLHAQLCRELGRELPELDLGGGFGVAYTTQHDPLPPEELATGLAEIVDPRVRGPRRRRAADLGRTRPRHRRAEHLHALLRRHGEGGRAGRRAGPHLRRGRRRHERQHPDGAVRRGLLLHARLPRVRRPPVLARVVGKHCESGDIVVKDEFLPGDVAGGDLVAVPGTGAYCRSMASQYNHVPRPPVLAVRDGAVRVLVRRETEDDLLALDLG